MSLPLQLRLETKNPKFLAWPWSEVSLELVSVVSLRRKSRLAGLWPEKAPLRFPFSISFYLKVISG